MNEAGLSSEAAERSVAAYGKHLIFFDGVCGLCNKSVQFVLDHDKAGLFYYAALQSGFAGHTLAKYGDNPSDLDSIRVLSDYQTAKEKLYTRSDAALFVLRQLGGWQSAVGHLTFIPAFIRDAVYKFVALIRYRLFGKYDSCRLPDPQTRSRFIEV